MKFLVFLLLTLTTVIGCSGSTAAESDIALTLPPIEAVTGANGPVQVVATTSIIGDVVDQVGAGAIVLTTLMAPGQDPHAYEPNARDLLAVARADIVFVHGWDLEEGLAPDLPNIAKGPIVPVAAGIVPRDLDVTAGISGGNHVSDRDRIDPHTWLDPTLVIRWVDNIEASLSALDPAHAADYATNAAVYRADLATLDTMLQAEAATIAAVNRVLVTNHDALGYFATRYGFTVVGTVIPNTSTLSEPSANDLTALIEAMRTNGVCAIFTETISNTRLADTVARALGNDCNEVMVLPLYTGALGEPGSGADSYIGLMEANMATIRRGLAER